MKWTPKIGWLKVQLEWLKKTARKRVRRLMRQMGLESVAPKPGTTVLAKAVASNLYLLAPLRDSTGLIFTRHPRRNPAPRREGPNHFAAARPACRHEIVEQAINDVLVENPLVAVALQIEFEGLQLHAQLRWCVGEGDGAEIRLARLGTEARELRTDDLDGVIAAGVLVGKGFQLRGGRRACSRENVLR